MPRFKNRPSGLHWRALKICWPPVFTYGVSSSKFGLCHSFHGLARNCREGARTLSKRRPRKKFLHLTFDSSQGAGFSGLSSRALADELVARSCCLFFSPRGSPSCNQGIPPILLNAFLGQGFNPPEKNALYPLSTGHLDGGFPANLGSK